MFRFVCDRFVELRRALCGSSKGLRCPKSLIVLAVHIDRRNLVLKHVDSDALELCSYLGRVVILIVIADYGIDAVFCPKPAENVCDRGYGHSDLGSVGAVRIFAKASRIEFRFADIVA